MILKIENLILLSKTKRFNEVNKARDLYDIKKREQKMEEKHQTELEKVKKDFKALQLQLTALSTKYTNVKEELEFKDEELKRLNDDNSEILEKLLMYDTNKALNSAKQGYCMNLHRLSCICVNRVLRCSVC